MRQETPEWIKTVQHPVVAPVYKGLYGGWEGNWVGYNMAHDVFGVAEVVVFGQPRAHLAQASRDGKKWLGAAKAAEASGDQKKAATYMSSLVRLTRDADSDRAEIREAKQQRASR